MSRFTHKLSTKQQVPTRVKVYAMYPCASLIMRLAQTLPPPPISSICFSGDSRSWHKAVPSTGAFQRKRCYSSASQLSIKNTEVSGCYGYEENLKNVNQVEGMQRQIWQQPGTIPLRGVNFLQQLPWFLRLVFINSFTPQAREERDNYAISDRWCPLVPWVHSIWNIPSNICGRKSSPRTIAPPLGISKLHWWCSQLKEYKGAQTAHVAAFETICTICPAGISFWPLSWVEMILWAKLGRVPPHYCFH